MKLLKTESDMGCIKIFNLGLSTFFSNGYGDMTNTVEIKSKKQGYVRDHRYQFIGHFTVKHSPAYLSSYDCSDDIIHTFKKRGRYFVYLKSPLNFLIEYVDEETNS